MTHKRIAIIDDDPFLVAHLQQAIAERLTNGEVVGIEDPVAPAGFDAYVVDREFGGDSRGHDVIGRIRAIEPESLVLAYSAYLDRDFLRALLREGCEGAFDKGSLEELDAMISIIGDFLSRGRLDATGTRGFGGTVRAISGLVREWNLRLAERGRADAKVCGDA
jgi:DNA-binding NarL/FixJ family response regulator